MARRARLFNALSKGELSPLLYERVDLAQYYQAARRARDVRVLPQGGFTRRFGTEIKQRRLRRRLEPVVLSADMITAHNGGTVANLLDGDTATLFTTTAVATATHVVLEIDLGAPRAFAALDIRAVSCELLGRDNVLVAEFWDGAAWQPMPGSQVADTSARRHLRTAARTRRFAAPPGTVVTARSIRVAVVGGIGLGTISVGGLRLWAETSLVSPVRLLAFARSQAEMYELALTDHNIDIFTDSGAYVASLPAPVPAARVPDVNSQQSLDTLFLLHEDMPTQSIVRQGSADEWNIADTVFTNVPNLTASTAFGSSQDQIQEMIFDPAPAAGQQIVIELDTYLTAPITFTTAGDLPGQVAAALQTVLPAVTFECTLQSVTPLTVSVRFAGGGANRRWQALCAFVVGSEIVPRTVTLQQGLNAAGKLIGADTGYPCCAVVHQSRLILGGFLAAPETLLMSVVGSLFDFSLPGSPVTADRAIQFTLDTEAVSRILELHVGQHLQIFTETTEWWAETRTFDASQPINFVAATRHGVTRSVPVTQADETTLFMQKGGRTLRDFSYANEAQNYLSSTLSLLGPHQLTDVVDMAHSRATSSSEGSTIVLANADGGFVLMTLMRAQEIIAMVPCTSPGGKLRAVMADQKQRLWLAFERTAGTPARADLTLELWQPTGLFDAAVTASGAASDVIAGLAHLEGRTDVWALADGDVHGPFTVSGGQLMLPVAATTRTAGLGWLPLVETLDLRDKLQNEQPFRPPARVYEVALSLIDTGHVVVAANGQPPVEVALRRFDGGPVAAEMTGEETGNDTLGAAMMDRLFSGEATIEHLLGVTEHPRVTVTQARPAPLTARAIRYRVSY